MSPDTDGLLAGHSEWFRAQLKNQIRDLEVALSVPVLKGQNTLLVTEDGWVVTRDPGKDSGLVIRPVKAHLSGAVHYELDRAREVMRQWNAHIETLEDPEQRKLKVKPVNWRVALEACLASKQEMLAALEAPPAPPSGDAGADSMDCGPH